MKKDWTSHRKCDNLTPEEDDIPLPMVLPIKKATFILPHHEENT